VDRIRQELEAERATESYAKKQESAARRREKVQDEYVEDFQGAVLEFLRFHERHGAVSRRLAKLVAAHATPVGSGTVARTKRIPIERRAEAAVIAWMRHQTTAYDSMKIARVKGQRREVRRMLAARSRSVLEAYRQGHAIPDSCPLARALAAGPSSPLHP
jgi:leucyl aminopeptidase